MKNGNSIDTSIASHGKRLPGVLAAIAVVFSLTLFASTLLADRPIAPQLLPEETALCVRIHNSIELQDRFRETSLGRIFADPQMKPMVQDFYKAANEAYGRIQEQVGVTLPDLLKIPQGEICFALVTPEKGRVSFVLLAEVGDQLPTVTKLLAKARDARPNAKPPIIERIGDTELRISPNEQGQAANADEPPVQADGEFKGRRGQVGVRVRGNGPPEFCYFERDGVVVITDNREVSRAMVNAWNGEKLASLAGNAKYAAIMNRCMSDKDGSPQISWYVDPIKIVQRSIQGNFSAQTVYSILSGLGINGIKGLGGSMIFATEDYDSISHLHVALDNPRTGVLDILAIREGDTTPEVWVPNDVAAYMTAYWDAKQTFNAIAKIYNTFRGEDALSNDLRNNVSSNLGADLEKEVIPSFDGRFSYMQWIERPIKLNSQTTLVGARLKDAAEFQTVLDKIITKAGANVEKTTYRGITIYKAKAEVPPDAGLRPPQPCGAIVGDYLLASDSLKCLERAIDTQNDPNLSLSTELDFKLISSKISRQVGGKSQGMLTFSRPEEGMRAMYDLATSELGKQRLGQVGESNQFLGTIDRVLKANPLPPFEVISQYLSPAGGLLTNDDSGIHYMSFSLRRK